MGIIEHLMQEHVFIRSQFNDFRAKLLLIINEKSSASVQIENLLRALDQIKMRVSVIHHEKEEAILFPEMANHPRIREGGPRCGFISKYVFEETYVNELMAPIKSSGFTLEEHPHSQLMKDLLIKNSPLAVPLREHDTGYQALQYLNHKMNLAKEGQDVNFNSLLEYFDIYVRFMDLHIRKEDECLFVLARNILSSEVLERLEKRAIEFERAPQFDSAKQVF